jgi:ERCC4-type nuclease
MQETAEMVLAFADKLGREYSKGKNGFYMTSTLPVTTLSNTLIPESNIENLGSQEQTEKGTGAAYASVVKKVKKENVTPENIGEIVLSQIPGISSVTATAIILHFGSLVCLINKLTNPELKKEFENITYVTNGKTRRIGKTAYESIVLYLKVEPTVV